MDERRGVKNTLTKLLLTLFPHRRGLSGLWQGQGVLLLSRAPSAARKYVDGVHRSADHLGRLGCLDGTVTSVDPDYS